MIQEISYKVLQKVSELKWCYDSTIRDCIDCILYKYERKLEPEVKEKIFVKVKKALAVIQNKTEA